MMARALWISGAVVRASAGPHRPPEGTASHSHLLWSALSWGILALIGADLGLAYLRNPERFRERFRRPTGSELMSSLLGALATAGLIVVGIVLAALLA